ncbi:MAG: hypothetical protein JKY26_01980 [Pseudomonas sp.]|nr:hypothetical protein [Pseudomonas sp.]
MITSNTLILKLNLQAKLLSKSLNLPNKFGNDLLATAIYNHLDFEDLCDSIAKLDYALNFESLAEEQKLKYLFICEVEDKELIDDLHKEIEKMAIRLESKTVVNISKLDLISNLYKLFGLDDEAKYIIDAEDIKLVWQSCFESLKDPQAVLCCDLIINDMRVQLIATKFQFNECSLDNLNKSLNQNSVQVMRSNIEKQDIVAYTEWIKDSVDCLSNIDGAVSDERPEFYKINNQNYLIFGFILAPHKQNLEITQSKNLKVHVKNTNEKQVFILRFEGGKLALECIYLHKTGDGEKSYSPQNQWVQDTLLSHPRACTFPVIFNNACYLMPIRPFSYVDWLENAL